MESSAGKLYEIGLSTQPQLEKLEGRQGEKEAVQGWSASVQRERMMRNKLKAAEKDVNEWKAKAGKHAATATGHAIDAEDILAESYTFLSNVRGVAILLPDGEAKAMLNRVLEQHERNILTWPEQGVPLAKQHVPTVELADVSNCLAGMSLANTHETQKFNTQSVDTSALDVQTFVPGKQGVFISPMMKQKENQAQIPQQCGVGPIKPASVSKETRIALGGNAASPSSD
ncbi:hypothetical protein WJX79_006901 [Trebouxia sp. C0005]